MKKIASLIPPTFSLFSVTAVVMAAAVSLLILPSSAAAEIYRYTDQSGSVRYTDDLNMVPENQREKANQYQELQTTAPTPEQTTASGHNTPSEEKPATEEALAETSRQLAANRNALDNERRRLIEVQERLEKTPKVTDSKAEAGKHKARVAQFKEDARAYEQKRQAFEQDLARYNARVEALNQKRPETTTPSQTE